MLAKSHVISSMIIATPAINYMENEIGLYFLISVLLGSLFPDLDEEGSFLSRRVYIVSAIISSLTNHRGVTHTLYILLVYSLIGAVLVMQSGVSSLLVAGFVLGNAVHFLGDMTTKSGLAIFHPISRRKFHILPCALRIRTGSAVERYIIIPSMGALLLYEVSQLEQFANIVKM